MFGRMHMGQSGDEAVPRPGSNDNGDYSDDLTMEPTAELPIVPVSTGAAVDTPVPTATPSPVTPRRPKHGAAEDDPEPGTGPAARRLPFIPEQVNRRAGAAAVAMGGAVKAAKLRVGTVTEGLKAKGLPWQRAGHESAAEPIVGTAAVDPETAYDGRTMTLAVLRKRRAEDEDWKVDPAVPAPTGLAKPRNAIAVLVLTAVVGGGIIYLASSDPAPKSTTVGRVPIALSPSAMAQSPSPVPVESSAAPVPTSPSPFPSETETPSPSPTVSKSPTPPPSPKPSKTPSPSPTYTYRPISEVNAGDCVAGSNTNMMVTNCRPGTMQVLRRINNTTDLNWCNLVSGSTNSYWYGEQFSSFVLCMKPQ